MKQLKQLDQMDFFEKLSDNKREAVINIEKFHKWLKREYLGTLQADCLMNEEEKFRLHDGLLEIKKKQFVPIKDFIPAFNKPPANFVEDSIDNILPDPSNIEHYFISKLFARAFQSTNIKTRNDFSPMYDFLNDLFNKKMSIPVKEYSLTETEKQTYKDEHLIPYRYLYKYLKIMCLFEKSTNNVYFLGFNELDPTFRIDSGQLLNHLIMESIDIDQIYKSPIFYSLEINPNDAAKILDWSIIEVIELLDNHKIYSRNPIGLSLYEQDRDPRLIPLIELFNYIHRSNIDRKDEKIKLLTDYMEKLSQSIVNELEESKMPNPLFGNKQYQCLKNEYDKLKRKLTHKDKDKRKEYITTIIPIIAKIVKTVESVEDKSTLNLIDRTEFIKVLQSVDPNYPEDGEVIGNVIFDALPADYRHDKKGRQKKDFVWSLENIERITGKKNDQSKGK